MRVTVTPLVTRGRDTLTHSDSPTTVIIDLRAGQSLDSTLAELPPLLSLTDSVTHIVCSSWVCGIHGNTRSSITTQGYRYYQPND
jgi:hypothetical protein